MCMLNVIVWLEGVIARVRPIPCWRLIPDTIGCGCTDIDTDIGITSPSE